MTQDLEGKTECKPDPGPQIEEPDEMEEEEKSQWDFNKRPLTIREMIQLKVPPKEIFEAEGISLSIKWSSLIRLVNHKMISGKKLDLDTTMMDAIKAYSSCMSKSFL